MHSSCFFKYESFTEYFGRFKDNTEIVREVVDAGACIEVFDVHGLTPLMLACRSGMCRTARYLLEQGAALKSPRQNLLSRNLSKDIARIVFDAHKNTLPRDDLVAAGTAPSINIY